MSQFLEDQDLVTSIERSSSEGKSLYLRYGGRPTLEKLHKIFYDKIYKHPWLGEFFKGIDQTHIENQQSDFIAMLTGGPKQFCGRMPKDSHMHMYLTEELFMVRHEILKESIIEAGVAEQECKELLSIDLAFKKVLIKSNVNECKKRYTMDEIIVIENPQYRKTS